MFLPFSLSYLPADGQRQVFYHCASATGHNEQTCCQNWQQCLYKSGNLVQSIDRFRIEVLHILTGWACSGLFTIIKCVELAIEGCLGNANLAKFFSLSLMLLHFLKTQILPLNSYTTFYRAKLSGCMFYLVLFIVFGGTLFS